MFSFSSFSVNGRTKKFNQTSLESNKKLTCSLLYHKSDHWAACAKIGDEV